MSIRRIYTAKLFGKEYYFRGPKLRRLYNFQMKAGKKYKVDFDGGKSATIEP